MLLFVARTDAGIAATLPSGPGNGPVPCLVRVKFASGVELPVSMRFEAGGADSGYGELDSALEAVGATELRRVFSDGGRFSERRRRYGLHLWYDVVTDGSMTVNEAIKVLETVDVVEYAGGIYRAVPASDDGATEAAVEEL